MSIVAGNWARRVQITDANVSPSLTGFRALITQANLPAEIFSRTGVVDGGGDLRVCLNSDGTGQLPLDVVEFVKGTSTATLWTRFANFTSGSSLWLFYDKAGEIQPSTSAPFGRDEVWQDSTYRLGGDGQTDVTGTTTTTLNAGAAQLGTVNGFPAITPNSSTTDSGLSFDNSAVDNGYTGNLSMSAWVNANSSGGLQAIIACRQANTRQFDFRLENGRTSFLRSASPEVNPVLTLNQDYYLSMRVVGNTVTYYVDGAYAGAGNAGGAQSTQAIDITVGGYENSNNSFNGEIANADLLNGVELTGAFFATEYENQKNTPTFWTTSTPENTTGGAPNTAPVANPGLQQTVTEGTLVTLDGSGSSDADGDPLTYLWTQIFGATVTLSDNTAVQPTFTAPSGAVGSFVRFSLVVNDGTTNSGAATVNVFVDAAVGSNPPIANAGLDQSGVTAGQLVVLDGIGSTDPDNDPLTYIWTQTSGTTVSLATSSPSERSFTAPSLGSTETLVFSLVVNDGTVDSTPDTVNIEILADVVVNNPPVADAGVAQNSVPPNTLVTLDGSASADPDGDPLTYLWTQVVGPPVILSDNTAVQPTFTTASYAVNTLLRWNLVVNDGTVDSDGSLGSVFVLADTTTPTANAGPDQSGITTGQLVTLDGTASSDPQNDPLTYTWTQTAGTAVVINTTNPAQPTFNAPSINSPETLTFSLVVNDGTIDSVADFVNIGVLAASNAAPVANAGPDQNNVPAGSLVILDGSASFDPDGDPLTYTWTRIVGDPVILSNNNAIQPTFTAPSSTEDQTMLFRLSVSDGTVTNNNDVFIFVLAETAGNIPQSLTLTNASQTNTSTVLNFSQSLELGNVSASQLNLSQVLDFTTSLELVSIFGTQLNTSQLLNVTEVALLNNVTTNQLNITEILDISQLMLLDNILADQLTNTEVLDVLQAREIETISTTQTSIVSPLLITTIQELGLVSSVQTTIAAPLTFGDSPSLNLVNAVQINNSELSSITELSAIELINAIQNTTGQLLNIGQINSLGLINSIQFNNSQLLSIAQNQSLTELLATQVNEALTVTLSQAGITALNLINANQINNSVLLSIEEQQTLSGIISQQINNAELVDLESAQAISFVVSTQNSNANTVDVTSLEKVSLITSTQINEAATFNLNQFSGQVVTLISAQQTNGTETLLISSSSLVDKIDASQISTSLLLEIFSNSILNILTSEQTTTTNILNIIAIGDLTDLIGLTLTPITNIYTVEVNPVVYTIETNPTIYTLEK